MSSTYQLKKIVNSCNEQFSSTWFSLPYLFYIRNAYTLKSEKITIRQQNKLKPMVSSFFPTQILSSSSHRYFHCSIISSAFYIIKMIICLKYGNAPSRKVSTFVLTTYPDQEATQNCYMMMGILNAAFGLPKPKPMFANLGNFFHDTAVIMF